MSSPLTSTLSQSPNTPSEARAGATFDGGASADLTEAGRRLGRYVVLRQIGQGGMGVVYSAYDELLARRVALKLVRTDASGGGGHARILREAQALARLSHPHVVQVYEVSVAAGRVFLAMEHVEGSTLGAWTAARRSAGADLRELLDMYIQAGRGLAAAHAAGLVHRDFKPDNVLVGVDGRARVVDFGLVAAWADGAAGDGPVELTVAGLLGTPAYMSPEQFAGRTADARSDQFSFCVAVHEAVCGARPFAGADVESVRAAVAAGVAAEPRAGVPAWLWALLRRGLAADPADRFASMDALLAGLARDPAEVRRRRLRVAGLVALSGAVAVLVALVVQAGWARWLQHRGEQAAARSLASVEARVIAARGDGDAAAAEQIFAAFVGDPAHEGTAAVARAWLGEASRRAGDGARDAARAAFATAYLAAPSATLQAEALVGLVRHFHDGAETDAFAQAFALLERTHPEVATGPDLSDMRVEAALARRDLAGARAAASGATAVHRLAGALTGATATAHRGIQAMAVHGSHVLLWESSGAGQGLHLARRDAALTPVRSVPLPADTRWATLVGSTPFHVVVNGAAENVLARVDERGLTPVLAWPWGEAFALAEADLEGDGTRALYLGHGTADGISVARADADGAWRLEQVVSDGEALRSAVHGLAGLDLDGDGRDELVACLGGWHAFDVRVYQRDPGSTSLRLVARDKLGDWSGLTGVRVGGASLVAVNHMPLEGSALVFPPGQERGAPAGLYLYGLVGGALARRGYLALPEDHHDPWAGDVDGDGREDLVVHSERRALGRTSLHLQGEDGGFTQVHVGHLRQLGLVQLDDDAALELVGAIEEPDDGPLRVWTLGVGDAALPPVTPPAGEAALDDPDDATWTRQAGDAAALAEMGLLVDAAEALRGLGRRAAAPALAGAAYVRAAGLLERAMRVREAVPLYRAAAEVPAVADAATVGLVRAQLRAGAYDEAGEALTTALAAGELSAAARAELTRLDLAGGLASRVDVDLREPLAAGWDLADARALRREQDGLAIESQAPGVLLSLPVTLSGDLLELGVDLSVRQFEWSNDLEIGLVAGDDPGGEMPVKLRILASGTSRGGFLVTRHHACVVSGEPLVELTRSDEVPTLDAPLRVEMRVAFAAALGEVGCEVRVHGAPRGRHVRRRDVALPAGGRYLLVVRVRSDVPAWIDATIHRIGLRGATVRDEAPADPRRRALQRAVLARDAVATLAAFAAVAEPTARERGWQADALHQLGRRAEADAVWAGLLAGDGDRDVASRLRGEPGVYGPSLHAIDPAGQPRRLVAAWRNTSVNHLGDPQARRAMTAALAAVDVEAALARADDDAGRGDVAELLGWRARLWTRAGDPARARREFARALEIAATLDPAAGPRVNAWKLWIELATLAAAAGDVDGAREAVGRARAGSAMPMLVDDVVRARPALARLVE